MKDFWNKYKKYILWTLAVFLALFGAFAVGRYTVPTKTVEVEKKVEVIKEVIKIQTVERKIYVKAEAKDVRKEIITIKRPDGTVETKVVIDDKTKTNEASSMEARTDTDSHKDSTTVVETLKIHDSMKPQWRLTARVELGALVSPNVQPMLGIGVTAERRIIGPFFMGLSLGADLGFNLTGFTGPYGVKGGIVMGAEF